MWISKDETYNHWKPFGICLPRRWERLVAHDFKQFSVVGTSPGVGLWEILDPHCYHLFIFEFIQNTNIHICRCLILHILNYVSRYNLSRYSLKKKESHLPQQKQQMNVYQRDK